MCQVKNVLHNHNNANMGSSLVDKVKVRHSTEVHLHFEDMIDIQMQNLSQ